MNKNLVIITPTYNRSQSINILYQSLKAQDCKGFVWFICDDGSNEDYRPVVNTFKSEGLVDIIYERKDNSGKSKTLNYMFSKIQGFDFALIVDDDEILFPNAVSLVLEYVSKYKDSDCGMIDFNRESLEGKVISNFKQDEDFFMTVQKRKAIGYSSDGYTGYFVNKLNGYRFPSFDNEKYVAPSVLSLLVSQKYKLLWAKVSIGKTEYREDGITKSGRKMRLKSPCGMTYHALLMQHSDSGLKCKFAYSIFGYAYMAYSGHKVSDLKDAYTHDCKLLGICKPLGYLLSLYWKFK